MKFNFAVVQHKSGLLMISVDSLIGYLRKLDEEEHNLTFTDLAVMLEGMIERTEKEDFGS